MSIIIADAYELIMGDPDKALAEVVSAIESAADFGKPIHPALLYRGLLLVRRHKGATALSVAIDGLLRDPRHNGRITEDLYCLLVAMEQCNTNEPGRINKIISDALTKLKDSLKIKVLDHNIKRNSSIPSKIRLAQTYLPFSRFSKAGN